MKLFIFNLLQDDNTILVLWGYPARERGMVKFNKLHLQVHLQSHLKLHIASRHVARNAPVNFISSQKYTSECIYIYICICIYIQYSTVYIVLTRMYDSPKYGYSLFFIGITHWSSTTPVLSTAINGAFTSPSKRIGFRNWKISWANQDATIWLWL